MADVVRPSHEQTQDQDQPDHAVRLMSQRSGQLVLVLWVQLLDHYVKILGR